METLGFALLALILAGAVILTLWMSAARIRALKEADRLKDEFFALVSHELRTPLTSIVGYAELLLEDDALPAEQRRKYLDVVYRNGRRLLRLVGDMLFVAKIEAGKVDLEMKLFDLACVARESVETFAPRAERGGVELLAEIEDIGEIVGDAGRIGQAIDNLVSNAIKFTPAGGKTTVRTRRSTPGWVVVEVADTGHGIPDHDQSRLFESFYRTSDATRKSIEGTGLGLTIVKTIVEGHSGRISIESEEGAGTTFSVELPTGADSADTPIVAGHG
jgi:signal transduction histidine kinase